MIETEYPYIWDLKTANFTKDRGKVFSCFACGGGSSMGYKLSGFDVIGCNEIDPKMMKAYIENHNPKYHFLEPIQDFKNREDMPEELFNLDILDGSPPCSSFSMAGNREKDWGKEKKFKEGQSDQILDNLFFDFIDLAQRLQPKIVVSENVTGLLLGSAFEYVRRIYDAFDAAGYTCQHWRLDASEMGVPQKRQRVIFLCVRKDIAEQFMEQVDLFSVKPMIGMEFNNPAVPIRNFVKTSKKRDTQTYSEDRFGDVILDINRPSVTVTGAIRLWLDRESVIDDPSITVIGTFPKDYNYCGNAVTYIVGMSVPPVMMAKIADRVWDYWLSKI